MSSRITAPTILKLLQHCIHIRARQARHLRQLIAIERIALQQGQIGPRFIFTKSKLLQQRSEICHCSSLAVVQAMTTGISLCGQRE
jgi:hypothetical protein